MSHVESGIRQILENSKVYQGFIDILGGRSLYKYFVNEIVKPKEGCKILDIGCGTGVLLEYFEDNIDYTGIDLNGKYISKAKAKYLNKGTFITSKIDKNFKLNMSSKFDYVICLAVLHHLDDTVINDLLDNVKEILKFDGKFITLDPCRVSNQKILPKLLMDFDRGRNIKTTKNYEMIIRKHFSKVKMSEFNNLLRIPYTHCISVSSI